jgi:hypothetical protein
VVSWRAYREAIAEGGGLGLCAVGNGRGQAAGQRRGSRGFDGVDGGARAHALLQVEGEPAGSHCVCSLCREWEMGGGDGVGVDVDTSSCSLA